MSSYSNVEPRGAESVRRCTQRNRNDGEATTDDIRKSDFSVRVSAALFHTLSCGGQIFRGSAERTPSFLHVAHFSMRGEPVYIVLMIYSSVLDYVCGRMIYSADRQGKNGKRKKPFSACRWSEISRFSEFSSISDFHADGQLCISSFDPRILSCTSRRYIVLHLPDDVVFARRLSRNDNAAEKNFIYFGAYVAMFPQLIAGPVVRYSDIARELDCARKISTASPPAHASLYADLRKGADRNTMAAVADPLFENPASSLGVLGTWIAIIAYTFQIFFDFSGYSDMAIGMGRMSGLQLSRKNFNYPYISPFGYGILRRWHTSRCRRSSGMGPYIPARRKPLFSYKMAA